MSNKNLTGNKRILQDYFVDMYNTVQKWKNITLVSHNIISNICIVMHKNISDIDIDEELKDFNKLENLRSMLQNKMVNYEELYRKMKRILNRINAVSELSDLQQSNSSSFLASSVYIPFKAWPLSKFYSVAEEIVTMYKEEFKIKTTISNKICFASDKSLLIISEALWKYEVNINTCRLNMLLDSIFFELDLLELK